MLAEEPEFIYKEISYQVIGIAMKVHQILGRGFQAVVYKDALEVEFQKAGIAYKREARFSILYDAQILPHRFIADFIIDEVMVLEIKATYKFHYHHFAQTLNYLKAAEIKVGLLINFGEGSLDFKRVICTK